MNWLFGMPGNEVWSPPSSRHLPPLGSFRGGMTLTARCEGITQDVILLVMAVMAAPASFKHTHDRAVGGPSAGSRQTASVVQ